MTLGLFNLGNVKIYYQFEKYLLRRTNKKIDIFFKIFITITNYIQFLSYGYIYIYKHEQCAKH